MEEHIISDITRILNQYKLGYKSHNDGLFVECNHLIKPFQRLGVYSAKIEDEEITKQNQLSCNIPGCNILFNNIDDYNLHYNNKHKYKCSCCKKVLPNGHLLNLHLLENHDTYFELEAQRKEMYSCFLEECLHKSKNPDNRRDHCIREHYFPHNFRFDKINSKSQKQNKLNNNQNLMELGDEANSSSSPTNFHFGHHNVKTFAMSSNKVSKKSKKNSILDSNRMVTDLMESLPE